MDVRITFSSQLLYFPPHFSVLSPNPLDVVINVVGVRDFDAAEPPYFQASCFGRGASVEDAPLDQEETQMEQTQHDHYVEAHRKDRFLSQVNI